MSRVRLSILAAAAITATASPALAYDSGLVRIEPRPYYGAVISIEQGVRVYRPLPAQRLMIINPNQTPVSLSFNRTIEHKAAEGGGGGSHGSGGEVDGGGRYGGISGLGAATGTNPQVGNGASAGVDGARNTGHRHVRHVRKPAHH